MDDRALQIARRALLQEPQDRAAFLAGACAGDEGLLKQARETLNTLVREAVAKNSHEAPTAEMSAGGTPAPSVHSAPTVGGVMDEGPGTVIGLYKILQLIGEGGFGFVYMAQQSQPVKRRVALKILKPGMDTRQVIGRFETERQALAMMDHPNIARVHDAGATLTGRPYFVMELVKGVPITEYCDSAQLSTRERLDLFIAVCHAVQHAHHKGIIHRDIKPSNVLVTLHDDQPVVKVIDFGIAKAMNQELTENTVFTEFRGILGTPEYMSPEQAALSGLDIDARTDIYSLGVLLYELMAGSTPFDSAELRGVGIAEVQRIIKEEEPARPSMRIAHTTKGSTHGGKPGTRPGVPTAGGTKTAEAIAKSRRTDPSSLRKMLAGDLDWIVMKAMEKDRSRRYDTASAMADDIRRYLQNQPILARPPTAAYRFRKFARRNRVGIGAAAGVLCALLLTLAALGYGLLQARHERDMTAERETVTRARMLLSTMNSVRKYTADNVRPALQAQSADYNANFVKEMVPGFSAHQVYAYFRQNPEYADFVYKEASPNPTNKDNTADDFEKGLVNAFKGSGAPAELSGICTIRGARTFYIARPMEIKDAKCLDCHTTPQVAPPKQVAIYGSEGGYGWKMHEIVAAQVVYVPVSEAFQMEKSLGLKTLIVLAGVFLLVGLVSLLALRKA